MNTLFIPVGEDPFFRELREFGQSLFSHMNHREPSVEVSSEQESRDRERVIACRHRLPEMERMLVRIEEDLPIDYKVIFQSQLKRMVAKQTKEFKSWFWAVFNKHLQKCVVERPEVALSVYLEKLPETGKEQQKTSPCKTLVWPLEIQTMIYSLVDDLETFVELRQVNSACYTQFQHSQDALKVFLQERNPWIEPGERDLTGRIVLWCLFFV